MFKKRFSKVFTLILSVFFVTNVFCAKSFASNPCNLSDIRQSGAGKNAIRTVYFSHSDLLNRRASSVDANFKEAIGTLSGFADYIGYKVSFPLKVLFGYGRAIKAEMNKYIDELLAISEANGRCGVEIKEQGDFASLDSTWCDDSCARAIEIKVIYKGPQRWD